MKLSSKHRRTLQAIFENPVRSNVEWKKIGSLFSALGAELGVGRGSRVRLPSEVHRQVYIRAKKEGKSLNEYITEKLSPAN